MVVVDSVQMFPVPKVRVAGVEGRPVTAPRPVDVHVATVGEVRRDSRGAVVDVVAVGVMEMPVVQEVEVVVVLHLRMAAPSVVPMVVVSMGDVGPAVCRVADVLGHGWVAWSH